MAEAVQSRSGSRSNSRNKWLKGTVKFWNARQIFSEDGSKLDEKRAELWLSFPPISEVHLKQLVKHKEQIKKVLRLNGSYDRLVNMIKERTNPDNWTV